MRPRPCAPTPHVQTVRRIYALRESYDAAVGEPWPEDLPAEDIVRLEREGHTELARLTR